MQKINYYSATNNIVNKCLLGFLLAWLIYPATVFPAQQPAVGEILAGHYSRVGNSDSPSAVTGNNIYIKFFQDRWIGMLFVPYPYATNVEAPVITRVFEAAKKQTSTGAYLKGKFGLLYEAATVHIERYGYLEDRVVFECGSLAPCTIRFGTGFLELIKPGVINEHIIRYDHVVTG